MKNTLLVLVASLAVLSCKKSSIPKGPQNPIYNTPLQYYLIGLNDTTMMQRDTMEIPVEVKYISGSKVVVSIVPENQPENIVVTLNPVQEIPTFSTTLRLVSFGADTGSYAITLRGTASNVTRDFTLKLRVIPNVVNVAAELAGQYTETGACTGSGNINHAVTVFEELPEFNKIKIRGLYSGGNFFNVYADLDPANQALVIPQQEINGLSFSGSGSYTSTQITINYTATGPLVNDNCSTVLSR